MRKLVTASLVMALATWIGPVRAQEKSVVEVVRDVERAVVRINYYGTLEVKGPDGKTKEIRGLLGLGTGFLIEGGYIVTNDHVARPQLHDEIVKTALKGPVRYVVQSTAGALICSLVGGDQLADVAVLKLELKPPKALFNKDGSLPALKFADPKTIQVGQDVVAIGHGRGDALPGKPSVSRGIVSADDRVLADKSGLIQTDAVINHGNSGGPLLNLRGEVIGINTYVIEPVKVGDSTYGLGFARSAQTLVPFVAMLIKNKEVRRPSLGATLVTPDPQLAQDLGLEPGVAVTKMEKDSPLAKAGIMRNDILTRIGGQLLRNEGDLNNALAFMEPGQTVVLQFLRAGKTSIFGIKADLKSLSDEDLARATLERKFETVKITLK